MILTEKVTDRISPELFPQTVSVYVPVVVVIPAETVRVEVVVPAGDKDGLG